MDMKLKPNDLVLAVGVFICTLSVASAIPLKEKLVSKGKTVFEVIKQVPEHATIEYHVDDKTVQALSIPPGVYEISIKKLR
jgi:hypothetical protein